jgi:hypothetical protein
MFLIVMNKFREGDAGPFAMSAFLRLDQSSSLLYKLLLCDLTTNEGMCAFKTWPARIPLAIAEIR